MITLQNMIFANPIAYQIFPNMVNTYNTSTTTEYAVYSGYLNLYKDNKLVKQFTGTSTIDLSDVSGRIRFDNVTDTYSVVVGEWDLAKSQDQIMEDNIKQAMVLWYDLKRQGATNESMAENPVLRDLSGNGHDATCYNFAWSGMSGVGGYSQNYKKWYIYDTRVSATVTNIQINVTSVLRTLIGVYYQSKSDEVAFTVPSYKVRVSGLTDGQAITYRDGTSTVSYTIDRDGEYTLPQIDFSAQGGYYGFILNKVQESCNITIEQLPIYPHAIVSDGVDDYCLVEGLPLLNKEDGYTVIAKRKILSDTGCIASKRNSVEQNGAFVFEIKTDASSKGRCDSFGSQNSNTPLISEDVSWQKKDYYNGTSILFGGKEDTDELRLLCLFNSYYCSAALYSFLLFNRDLAPEEIEWVKTNYLQSNT